MVMAVPEARMLVIAPWDQGSLPAVADAIRSSDLGLNPADDGHVIRLSLPMLTEDRRKELAKVLNARAEEARVSIRTVREDVWKDIQELEKEACNEATRRSLRPGCSSPRRGGGAILR